jgi:hypothetical protein
MREKSRSGVSGASREKPNGSWRDVFGDMLVETVGQGGSSLCQSGFVWKSVVRVPAFLEAGDSGLVTVVSRLVFLWFQEWSQVVYL